MLGEITYWGAMLAGFVAFFTPCILPMVPFYLSYMAGLSMSELRGDGDIAPGAQRRLVVSAAMFALGVTTIFMLLGLGATALGQAFAQFKEPLSYLAAAVIFLFGLHFLGVIRIGFLYREARMESKADPSTVLGAYLMGLAFGFGWTACVGPAVHARSTTADRDRRATGLAGAAAGHADGLHLEVAPCVCRGVAVVGVVARAVGRG